jgi:hypothetical protein
MHHTRNLCRGWQLKGGCLGRSMGVAMWLCLPVVMFLCHCRPTAPTCHCSPPPQAAAKPCCAFTRTPAAAAETGRRGDAASSSRGCPVKRHACGHGILRLPPPSPSAHKTYRRPSRGHHCHLSRATFDRGKTTAQVDWKAHKWVAGIMHTATLTQLCCPTTLGCTLSSSEGCVV